MTDSTKPGAGAVPQYTGDEATVRCFLGELLFAHEALDRLLSEAELRGQRSRDAEVERLTEKLAQRETEAGEMFYTITDLKAQLTEVKATAVTDEQLAADLDFLFRYTNASAHREALSRITAALARGGK